VFWIGESLTPWLERSLEDLSPDSKKIELLEAKGTTTYAFRKGATFDAHDDNDLEMEIALQTEHSTDDDAHHDHSGIDPHAWLNSSNGRVWLDVIAVALAEKDPENAMQYFENADIGKAQIDAAVSHIEATMVQFNDKQFIVFHDAYQYFEKRFKIQAAGSISISDASKPSPARIAEIFKVVTDLNVNCVFTEPQYNPEMVKTVFGGTGVNTSGVIDPLGADLVTGVNLYPNLLIEIANGLKSCLGEK
jgi:zinc transport system substrate-binding protein